jgi:hypothetical protein
MFDLRRVQAPVIPLGSQGPSPKPPSEVQVLTIGFEIGPEGEHPEPVQHQLHCVHPPWKLTGIHGSRIRDSKVVPEFAELCNAIQLD